MNLTFAAQLNKMITAGLGGAVEAPETGVAVGRRLEYTSIGPAPILTFEANSEIPLKALSVNMEPIQEGSGDPSPENIRPISGRQSVTVTRSGVNVWDEEWENGSLNNNGQPVAYAGNMRSKNFISIVPNASYYGVPTGNIVWYWYDSEKTFIKMDSTSSITATAPSNARYLKFRTTDGYGGTYKNDISINYPSTDHDYHPGIVASVTVQLGQTVYGGTVDVVSGVLTVDREMVTYDGSENWYANAVSGGVEYRMALDSLPSGIKTVTDNTEIPDIITNILPAISANESWRRIDGVAMQTTYGWRIYCEAFNTSDAAPWKAFLAEHPLTVVYKLAQPITITLTGQQLSTVLGQNNVWSDADEVSLTYGNIYYTEGY